MRTKVIYCIAILLIPFFSFTQIIENIDYISPFNEGVAAIKKGEQWAFINEQGFIIIAFRSDLVLTKTNTRNYPIFKSNRCLIVQKREGVSYFGYIDKSGKTIIAPKFLNAKNFIENTALALELIKEDLGFNEIFKKPVVNYRYFEVIIDTTGASLDYLTKGKNVSLAKKFLIVPPKFTCKHIAENLVAILGENKKWNIMPLNN